MMVAEIRPDPGGCGHCGLPIPPGPRICAKIGGVEFKMCCIGCCAVAEMLESQGLGAWYERREEPPGVPAGLPTEVVAGIPYLGADALEDVYVDHQEGGLDETTLLVDGLRCAACVWIIEGHVGRLAGVRSVRVNLSNHRVRVEWDGSALRLRDLVERLAEIGFASRPDRPGVQAEQEKRENRSALIRLGVAGLGAMNVMTYAVALYAGGFDGIGRGAEALMRWMGLIVSTPIVLISARPFFEGALRDLKHRSPGMDVPVALAIGGACGVSAIATVSSQGDVYFDSVCMFTFFLSLGRYLEMRVRQRSSSFVREMIDATPVMARRLSLEEGDDREAERVVLARSLAKGDRLRVLPSEAIPADGIVVEGRSAVDEALLSGEPWPRSVSPGDAVVAGSQNVDQTLVIEADRVGQETTLASILALVERAASERAPVALLADRVARVFVLGVLAVAIVNAFVWNLIAPDRAVWTTLAVLVATCPCALSLATPMAIGAASEGLARAGFLVTNPKVLEALARIDRFIFDKTGTLTKGRTAIRQVVLRAGESEAGVLELAGALEQESVHPIAYAFRSSREGVSDSRLGLRGAAPEELRSVPGHGIEGVFAAQRYRIGRPDWVLEIARRGRREMQGQTAGSEGVGTQEPPSDFVGPDPLVWILLGGEEGALAWFALEDAERPTAMDTVRALWDRGRVVEMLTGDPSPAAKRFAERLGLEVDRHGATPESKLERVRQLQGRGESVAVVGDGLNDSPSLRAGDVSIAMESGCDLTRLNADAVLLKDRLEMIPVAYDWARRTQRVIKQNLYWALGYNLIALPLAVSGHLAPWMAAIGMSASSLLVVLNASRLKAAPESR